VFVANRDSNGNDVERIEGGVIPHTTMARLAYRSDVAAFNTNGFVKRTLGPFSGWEVFGGANPAHGSYVKISALVGAMQAYGVEWFGSGWTFFPNVDASGTDIGKNDQAGANLAVAQSAPGNCVAFNTNGWMKHTIIGKQNFSKFADSGVEGSFVRSSHSEASQSMKARDFVVLGNWVFVPFFDANGNDIRQSSNRDNWKALLEDAKSDSSCVAFNTNGWLKRAISPRARWERFSSNAFQGTFIRLDAWAGFSHVNGADWHGSGWTFFPNKDSGGADIGQVSGARDLASIFATAQADARVVCFNSNGWLKSAVLPRAQWTSVGGPGEGMWVRNANVPA
jgi:hypothetical protein